MVHIHVKNVSLHYQILERSPKKFDVKNTKVGAKVDFNEKRVEALRDISLELKEGDRLALIGRNGGGKSTLLNILAGILEPTSGSVDIKGEVSAIFNVGLGIRRDSTGLKNIQIRSKMAGLNPEQTEKVIESVMDFAELGEYIHLPVRLYSSGMSMRLNFALSTAIESEILLLDEWIGTGDVAFREKVAKRMQEYVGQAKILVLASHSMAILRKACTTALWLEQGAVKAYGPMEEVAIAYGKEMMPK